MEMIPSVLTRFRAQGIVYPAGTAYRFSGLLIFLVFCLSAATAGAAEIRLAVASNFINTMRALAADFESRSDHRLVLVPGATGKHYAQIMNGAPFDIFLAADSHRPRRLEQAGRTVTGSRFTYATGRLVLWSADESLVDPDGRVLETTDFRRLALAKPKLAPYGEAARQVLESRGLWDRLQDRLVQGENVGQAFQFVATGNAELGFVAYAQIRRPGTPFTGSCWEVPPALYRPIEQQAVLLTNRPATRSFWAYLTSTEARTIIRDHGYLAY